MSPDKQQFIDNYLANPDRYAQSPFLNDPEVLNAIFNPPERKVLSSVLGNDICQRVTDYAKLGASKAEIAKLMKITQDTLNRWLKEYPALSEAFDEGTQIANARVKKAMFQRAIGYTHPDVHISNYQGNITVTEITKHHPPDTRAGMYWLNNRDPDEWKDKRSVEHQHEFVPPEERRRKILALQEKLTGKSTPVTIDQ